MNFLLNMILGIVLTSLLSLVSEKGGLCLMELSSMKHFNICYNFGIEQLK